MLSFELAGLLALATSVFALPARASVEKLVARQQVYTGDATYYEPGLGACGVTNGPNDFIAAVSHELFDTFPGYNGANPNDNPICGKTLTANADGNTVTVTVVDECEGCSGLGDLDFSPAAFQQLAPLDVGRIQGMTWSFDD